MASSGDSSDGPPAARGRSALVDFLRQVRANLGQGRAAVLVRGPAGIGKSTLVQRTFGDLSDGVYGIGKGEQFGSTHPYRPLTEALGDALQRWLKFASPAQKDGLRSRLTDFDGVLTRLVPTLGTLLPAPPPTDPPEARHRVPFALRALVLALTRLAAPVVLVLDDLQWVDEATLRRVELGLADPEQHGLLGVFCTRDDPAALRRGRECMKRLALEGVATLEVAVGPLSDQEVGRLVAERLDCPEEQIARLAELVCSRSRGSPLYVHHAVEYLAAGGALERWEQDGDSDVLDLLTRRLADFNDEEREVLALLACAGSNAPTGLVTKAAAKVLPGLDADQVLRRATQAGLLVEHCKTLLRMSHDRVQEACAGHPAAWPARHLALWEAGAQRLDCLGSPARPTDDCLGSLSVSEVEDDELFWLLDRQRGAASLLRDHPRRLLAVQLAIAASRRARLRAAGDTALKASTLAHRLLVAKDQASLRGEVMVEHAVAAWLADDGGQFEILAREAESLVTPLQLVPVTELRLQEVIARGEASLTVTLALEAVRRLLPSLVEESVPPPAWEDAAAVEQLMEELRHIPANSDPALEAVHGILSTANAAAYVGAPSRLGGLVALQLGLARKTGAPNTFPVTLAFWAAILATRPQTMVCAQQVALQALSMADRGGDGQIQARTADLAYGMVLCWQDDPRLVVEPLRENSRQAIRHGTYEYGGYSLLKCLAYQLFTSSQLDELAVEVETGILTMKLLGQTRMVCYLEREAAVLRRLQEPGDQPESLEDETFSLQALLGELRASNDHYGLLYTAVSRLLLAVVFEREEAAQELTLEAETLGSGGPGLLHQGMLSWLGALAALLPQAPVGQERLDRAEAGLSRLQALAPQGGLWHPRCALIRAELARHRGLRAEAAVAYDEAAAAAQAWGKLPLDLYLIYRRRALLEPERADFWRGQAKDALRGWRGKRAEPAVPPDPGQLEAAANVATATTVEALGSALLKLLEATASHGLVAGPSGRVLASWNWNAPEGFAAAELEALLSGRSLPARGDRLGQSLVVGETVRGAILLYDEGGFSAGVRSLLESAARLASSALLGMGSRRAEAEWGERETLYATLTQECPAGLFARDREGRLIWANQAYAKALHAELHSLLGRRLTDALPSVLAEEQQRECQSVIDEEREVESLVRVPGPDGQVREYMVHRVPLWDRHGRVMGMCGVTTDLTELRRAQEQLERQRRLQALGNFAAGIAHDVNNMVTVIGCNLDLLELTVGDDPRWSESLLNIRMASRRALDLAERILLFGENRSSTGSRLDLPALLEESARLCRSTLPPGAVLEVEAQPCSGAVYGDPVQIGQVISNLVSNAAHALLPNPSGGVIKLKLEGPSLLEADLPDLPKGRYACLVVEDNGTGMSSDTLRSAFDPYFTTKPRGEGAGLGLSIVFGIVNSMGGSISVDSRPGQGTTFRLYLPVSDGVPAEDLPTGHVARM